VLGHARRPRAMTLADPREWDLESQPPVKMGLPDSTFRFTSPVGTASEAPGVTGSEPAGGPLPHVDRAPDQCVITEGGGPFRTASGPPDWISPTSTVSFKGFPVACHHGPPKRVQGAEAVSSSIASWRSSGTIERPRVWVLAR